MISPTCRSQYKYFIFSFLWCLEQSFALSWIWSMMALTHWGRNRMEAISQTTCSSAFSWIKKMFEFRLKFHWGLFLKVQLTIFQDCFRYWLGAVQWWLVHLRIYASLGLNELKAVSEPMLAHHRWHPLSFSGQLHKKNIYIPIAKMCENYTLYKLQSHFPVHMTITATFPTPRGAN